MTTEQAVEFFTSYAAAFDAFDSESIARHFEYPNMIVTPGGAATFQDRHETRRNYDRVNEYHKSVGYDHAELSGCRVEAVYSDELARVRADWVFRQRGGAEIDAFPMEYLLRRSGGRWRIVVAINIDG